MLFRSSGVNIGGYVTKPCSIVMHSAAEGIIAVTEGKYHQIRLMMEAVGNKIILLERISFGPLKLDPKTPRGTWRELSAEEERQLQNAVSAQK